jgi:hypothetical protein
LLSTVNAPLFRGSASLQQRSTQLDYYGSQITVEHTYPSDDPDYPDETKTQGATASVLLPQARLTADMKIAVWYPDYVVYNWLGTINAAVWRAASPYTWLCTGVDFEQADTEQSAPVYDFAFEFMYSNDGWDPQVIFIDQRTGKPPPNLVAGVGYKTVYWYHPFDYNWLFPV